MEHIKSKSLPSLIFILLACLTFIRPFFSGLTYPVFEFYYETAVISLAIITLFLSLREVYLKHNRDVHAKNSYAIPILLLSFAYMLSTITSINMQNSLKETIKFISYISIFFVVSHAGDKQKKNLVKIIVICASIISIYCIYQYMWGYQHTLDYFEKINSNFISVSSYARDILIDKRALGTFPSPNILGSYLLITLFLSLVILENTKARQKWLLAPFLMLIALALTKSLGAWLSLMGAITILFFISYNTIKKRKLTLISFIICIISVLVFIILNRWDRLINPESSYNSITQRLNYWQTAIAVIKDHPIFGIGPGNFQEVFLKYKIGLSTNTRYAHNIFLQLWAETGILGLLGMVSLIVAVVTKNTVKSKYLFLAGLSFLFHNLIDLTYFIPEAGLFWWIVISLAK